jgi:hypothetical protein
VISSLIKNFNFRNCFVPADHPLSIPLFLLSFALQPIHLCGQSAPMRPSAHRLQVGDWSTVLYRLTPELKQTIIIEQNGGARFQIIGPIESPTYARHLGAVDFLFVRQAPEANGSNAQILRTLSGKQAPFFELFYGKGVSSFPDLRQACRIGRFRW